MKRLWIVVVLALLAGERSFVLGHLSFEERGDRDSDSVSVRLPDTVRMLLFPAFSPRRVEVESRGGMRVEGRTVRRAVIEVSDDGRVTLDGAGSFTSLAIAPLRSTDSMVLVIPQRRRSLAARLTVAASDGKLQIVVALPLRDYLAATLAAETSSGDPPAYLAALAVVQRNFLLLHPRRHAPFADVCDNTHCQAANPERITPRVRGAVAAAEPIELGEGSVRPAFYAACCGGGTLTPAQVWGTPVAGYTNVECNRCRSSLRYRWEHPVPATPEVDRLLRGAPAPPFVNDDLRIALGRLVGFNLVLSNTFDRIVRRGREYRIAGRGFGHRVGLCQEGARTLARNGWSPERILRYYFPSVPITVHQEER